MTRHASSSSPLIWAPRTRPTIVLTSDVREALDREAALLVRLGTKEKVDQCAAAARRLIPGVRAAIWVRRGEWERVAGDPTCDGEPTGRFRRFVAALDDCEAKQLSGIVFQRLYAAFIAPAASGPPRGLSGSSTALVVRAVGPEGLAPATLVQLELIAIELLPLLPFGRRHHLTHLQAKEAELLALLGAGCDPVEIADHLGISPQTVTTRTKHLYRRLGVRSRAELLHIRAVRHTFCAPWRNHPKDPLSQLSPRHLQVVRALSRGLSEKEAAAALGVSQHTIHEHIKLIYRRLAVRSRSELLSLLASRETAHLAD